MKASAASSIFSLLSLVLFHETILSVLKHGGPGIIALCVVAYIVAAASTPMLFYEGPHRILVALTSVMTATVAPLLLLGSLRRALPKTHYVVATILLSAGFMTGYWYFHAWKKLREELIEDLFTP